MQNHLHLSFEFFPPKTPVGTLKLQETWRQLASVHPDFFSVTFGACGSTRDTTAATVLKMHQDIQSPVAPHLSCIGSTRAAILELLTQYHQNKINKLVVLRGDYPSGSRHTGGDFRYASELVAFIRQEFGDFFTLHVAAYPECHPESASYSTEINHFKQKIDEGADIAITQYFYNADAYFYFVEACQRAQITVPIIPGIMPIQNLAGLKRFSERCGADIPAWLDKRLSSLGDDQAVIQAFGIEIVTRLCQTLLKNGAPGLHFYTLNNAEPSLQICRNLIAS